MATAVLDTIFGFRSKHDQYHEPATEILTAIDAGELPVGRVTNYVVAESPSLIGERATRDVAAETLDFLVEGSGFEIGHATRSDFISGRAPFRQYPNLTFVDATTVAYMQREDVEYVYSFGRRFRRGRRSDAPRYGRRSVCVIPFRPLLRHPVSYSAFQAIKAVE